LVTPNLNGNRNTLTVIFTLKQQLKKACENTEFRLNERLRGIWVVD
jgi:hypothetical protein